MKKILIYVLTLVLVPSALYAWVDVSNEKMPMDDNMVYAMDMDPDMAYAMDTQLGDMEESWIPDENDGQDVHILPVRSNNRRAASGSNKNKEKRIYTLRNNTSTPLVFQVVERTNKDVTPNVFLREVTVAPNTAGSVEGRTDCCVIEMGVFIALYSQKIDMNVCVNPCANQTIVADGDVRKGGIKLRCQQPQGGVRRSVQRVEK
jgi:hypothetical protein